MFTLSSYFSIQYLIVLLPITILLYAILSQKLRRLVILLSSYVFFWAISGKLIAYLIISTFAVHYIGIWISSIQTDCDRLVSSAIKEKRKEIKAQYIKYQRAVLAFGVLFHIGILLALKYTPFFASNINSLLEGLSLSVSIKIPSFALPIGISFYSLQAVSYLVDVYRRRVQADRNLLRLALFMSFFPQIMEGPICRYADTADKLWDADRIQWNNLSFGLQRILFGIMKKMIVADRLNMLIQTVFDEYQNYDGFIIMLAAVCYTIQLYMDFSGTMDLVIGSGQIFGVKLPENFQRPFFSCTISEFWKRWHITLGTWFKDYIFYPLSMSKPLKKLTTHARKRLGNHFGPLVSGSIALFCVWICNGLWHGAGWHYIFFGMYHFSLILAGSIIEPFVIRWTKKLHIRRDVLPYRCMQMIRTGLIVCIGEMFFRAHGLKAGLAMFQKIITEFTFDSIRNGSIVTLGMDKYDFLVVFFAMIGILVVGIVQEKGFSIRNELAVRHVMVRYGVYYSMIMLVVIFGAYGSGYLPVDPIYAGF